MLSLLLNQIKKHSSVLIGDIIRKKGILYYARIIIGCNRSTVGRLIILKIGAINVKNLSTN